MILIIHPDPEDGMGVRAPGRLERRPFPTVLIGLVLMALLLLGGCSQGRRHAREGSRRTLLLDARSDWQPTGLLVRKGEKVHIQCQGTWAVAPEDERQRWPDTGAEGHGNHPGERIHRKGDPKKELPGVPFGTLLGKVSDTIFAVGDQNEIIAPAQGELYLVINDYPFYRHDNRGGLTVTIGCND